MDMPARWARRGAASPSRLRVRRLRTCSLPDGPAAERAPFVAGSGRPQLATFAVPARGPVGVLDDDPQVAQAVTSSRYHALEERGDLDSGRQRPQRVTSPPPRTLTHDTGPQAQR